MLSFRRVRILLALLLALAVVPVVVEEDSDWIVPEGVRKESNVWGVVVVVVVLLDSGPLVAVDLRSGSDLEDVIFLRASFGGLVIDMVSAVEGPNRRVKRSVLGGLACSTGVANVVMISGGGGLGAGGQLAGIESLLAFADSFLFGCNPVLRGFRVCLAWGCNEGWL